MHPAKADHFLNTDAAMERVVAKARELRALARACLDFLPPELGRQLRAANLKDGELSLLAANPATAAKLKLLAESLRKALLQQGTKVNSVSVRVQPTQSHAAAQARPKSLALSEAGKTELSKLYESLGEASPVRHALGVLLDHQSFRTRSPGVPQIPATGRKRRHKPRT